MTTDRTAGAGSGATSAVAAWRRERPWRTAVWALRFGYVALISVIVGVAILASTGSRFLLGAGVVLWLCAAAVSITCVVRTRRSIPEPKPDFWTLRLTLVDDSAHAAPVVTAG